MAGEQLSIARPLIAPELQRRARNTRLTTLALLLPAFLLAVVLLVALVLTLPRLTGGWLGDELGAAWARRRLAERLRQRGLLSGEDLEAALKDDEA